MLHSAAVKWLDERLHGFDCVISSAISRNAQALQFTEIQFKSPWNSKRK